MTHAFMSRRSFLTAACSLGATELLFPFQTCVAETRWHERMLPLMGTYVSVAVSHQSRTTALTLLGKCFEHIELSIGQISNWQHDSIVSRMADGARFALQDHPSPLLSLYQTGATLEKLSGGAFVLLASPLTSLWRQAALHSSVPDKSAIKQAIQQIRASRLDIHNRSIGISGAAGFDVGGIGKGLIADIACGFLREAGIEYARIDCGGDLRLMGAAGTVPVEIEHPRDEHPLGILQIPSSWAVATSGDYRNCWSVNGIKYHHILDARTGMPVRMNQQVTVVAPTALSADALASALFPLSPAQASRLLDQLPHPAAALFVLSNGTVERVSSRRFPALKLLQFHPAHQFREFSLASQVAHRAKSL